VRVAAGALALIAFSLVCLVIAALVLGICFYVARPHFLLHSR
jgi:hypothetical protein